MLRAGVENGDAMKTLLASLALIGSLGAIVASPMKQSLAIQPNDLKWEQPFGPQGPSLALLVGRLGDQNPASYFMKFRPGADTGWHTHTHDYEAVVLRGTFAVQEQGEAEKQLPAGSFFTQAGKQNHRNRCVQDGEDCLLFIHFEHGADGHPMTPEGKPLEPQTVKDPRR
jgi:quercetin dioxygenase-like cupin family protein